MTEIFEGLYLGSYQDASSLDALTKNKIKSILVCADLPAVFPGVLG